jgi:hypothetical protein
LHNLKLNGEAASAGNGAASTFPAQLSQLIEEDGYCARQVFNVDETVILEENASQNFHCKGG